MHEEKQADDLDGVVYSVSPHFWTTSPFTRKHYTRTRSPLLRTAGFGKALRRPTSSWKVPSGFVKETT
jgi:hypothetical protein